MIQLRKSLGFFDALALVVGSMIGTGIFLKAATMSQLVGSPGLVIAAWVCAGVLSLAGAFTYAEIGSRFPKAGGEYIYLREAYGKLPAFLFGWTRFWIASPASVAAYGVGSATFLSGMMSLEPMGGRVVVSIGFIAIFTALNCFAVSYGGRLQSIMTCIKAFMVIGLIAGVGLFSSSASVSNFSAGASTTLPTLSAFGSAMIAALWAYDGWNNLPMASGEVKNPGRNIPWSLILGTLIVLVIYVAANISYFYALPFSEALTANSKTHPDALPIASMAVLTFLGPVGVAILSLCFVFSALGSMNGSILTGARVPYAMASDGLFLKTFAKLSPKTHVPANSVLIQGVWSCILALSGTFDQLTDWVVFASWIFYAAVTFSVFTLRKRTDVPPATYHTWGYPVVPIVFCLVALALLINTVYTSPTESLFGLGFILLGVPTYYYFAKANKSPVGDTDILNERVPWKS